MNEVIASEMMEVIDAVHYRPAVSIIIPFEPKMNLKEELKHSLKCARDKAELILKKDYNTELGMVVIGKLDKLLKGLNFDSLKKSIAVYVSPVFEKVLYLDIAVEEKIIVDESFEIRDLVYSKKQNNKFLLLVLSASQSKLFLGNNGTLIRLLTANPGSIQEIHNNPPGRVANFSDMSEHKEVLMHKFLKYADDGIDPILNAYHLPLFVLAPGRVAGHFDKITRHKKIILEYIHGNYDDADVNELTTVLQPFICNWKQVKQKELLQQLEEAAGNKRLATGIKEVWADAVNKKGQLLVVERNYMYPAEKTTEEKIEPLKPDAAYKPFSCIHDAVDDIIEKVLDSGGDVEFTDEGQLSQYRKIALIRYY
jgi:hypothetical protein